MFLFHISTQRADRCSTFCSRQHDKHVRLTIFQYAGFSAMYIVYRKSAGSVLRAARLAVNFASGIFFHPELLNYIKLRLSKQETKFILGKAEQTVSLKRFLDETLRETIGTDNHKKQLDRHHVC